MVGTNGLDPLDELNSRTKCKASPTKRQYFDSQEAWKAAGKRSNETGLEIVAYACPDCGYFHLTKKVKGSDVVVTMPVGISTGALRKKTQGGVYTPPERVELPDESPIVPGNPDAKHKLLAEYLSTRTEATTQELWELLGVKSNAGLRPYIQATGWHNTRGPNAKWVPGPRKSKNQARDEKRAEMKPVITISDYQPKPDVSKEASLARVREARSELDASISRHPAGKAQVQWRDVDLHPLPPTMTVKDLLDIYKAAGLNLRLQVSDR